MEKEFARLVQRQMSGVFRRSGSEDRGIKDRPLSRGERGYYNVNQLFCMPSILIEPFFGDNKTDAKAAVEKKQELAEAIIFGFEDWKGQVAVERSLIPSYEISRTARTPDTPHTPATRNARRTASTKRTATKKSKRQSGRGRIWE